MSPTNSTAGTDVFISTHGGSQMMRDHLDAVHRTDAADESPKISETPVTPCPNDTHPEDCGASPENPPGDDPDDFGVSAPPRTPFSLRSPVKPGTMRMKTVRKPTNKPRTIPENLLNDPEYMAGVSPEDLPPPGSHAKPDPNAAFTASLQKTTLPGVPVQPTARVPGPTPLSVFPVMEALLDTLPEDYAKAQRGVCAAGTRARKALGTLKRECDRLRREILAFRKQKKHRNENF